jgi:hypothetical protein
MIERKEASAAGNVAEERLVLAHEPEIRVSAERLHQALHRAEAEDLLVINAQWDAVPRAHPAIRFEQLIPFAIR